jgi:multimeric flavodoxin WrbA
MITLKNLLNELKLASSSAEMDKYARKFIRTADYLKTKHNVLCLTTSNRWKEHTEDVPKSTLLAQKLQELVGTKTIDIIDVSKLKIYQCEGNVSSSPQFGGNHCGVKDARLKDNEKNPSGYHRCWASINHKSDELWKVSKKLFESDCVLFLGSIRWGQANGVYQKLIERLTWIENRYHTLGEANIVKNIDAGLICTGQNWNGKEVVKTQKEVLDFFGFNTPKELFWNWQYTDDENDESKRSYNKSWPVFKDTFNI